MYNGKKIFVLGLARSGYEVSKLLLKNGAIVTVSEVKDLEEDPIVEELRKLGATVITGSQRKDLFDESFDLLVKNPGVKYEHVYIQKAIENNIDVVTEIEVAYHFVKKGRIIGITGTNGKSTTSTLIYEMLKANSNHAYLCGNIGIPLSAVVENDSEDSIFVIELSSFQLKGNIDFKADVSLFLNLSEDHLDYHNGYDDYKNSKKKIFANHIESDIAILNRDDEEVLKLNYDIKSTKKYFSVINSADAYLKGDGIYFKDELIINSSECTLVGVHNYKNILAAILAVKEFEVSNEAIIYVLRTFKGVNHRLQYVDIVNERVFYNDSKATNINSTIQALSSFEQPVIILMGGQERGQDFFELTTYMNYVKAIICYGETKERIAAFAETMMIENYCFDTLSESFEKAYDISNERDIILLSPACASWDQYQNFEIRGQEFIELVSNMK